MGNRVENISSIPKTSLTDRKDKSRTKYISRCVCVPGSREATTQILNARQSVVHACIHVHVPVSDKLKHWPTG